MANTKITRTKATKTSAKAETSVVVENAVGDVAEAVDVTPKVDVITPNNTVAPAKTVKVRLAKDHRCTLGGTTYNFICGQVYDVSVSVRNVLKRGDLLRPLK